MVSCFIAQIAMIEMVKSEGFTKLFAFKIIMVKSRSSPGNRGNNDVIIWNGEEQWFYQIVCF